LAIFPDGLASKTNRMPVTSLDPAPAYTKVAEASRAYAERVETGTDLPGALERAVKVIREEKRQVLLELRTVN
jgi:acetolactate synthase-1/2/3 large subunit